MYAIHRYVKNENILFVKVFYFRLIVCIDL